MRHAIFLSFDDKFTHHAKTCINSIKANYAQHPRLLINYKGNNPNTEHFLDELDNAERIRLTAEYRFRTGPVSNAIVFDRYELWTDRFEAFDTIMHLDVDTIVLRPFDYLFEESVPFVAADFHEQSRIFSIDDSRLKTRNDIPPKNTLDDLLEIDGLTIPNSRTAMINAGIFTLPKAYRTSAQRESLLGLARKYNDHVAYADQSIISLWCWKIGIPISSRFELNCQIRLLVDAAAKVNVNTLAILHYSGEAKYQNLLVPTEAHRLTKPLYDLCTEIRSHYRVPRTAEKTASFVARLGDTHRKMHQ